MSAITGPFDAFRIGPLTSGHASSGAFHLSLTGTNHQSNQSKGGQHQSKTSHHGHSNRNKQIDASQRAIKWKPMDRNQKALQFQREVMASLQRFAIAMHNYRERRLRRQHDEALAALGAGGNQTHHLSNRQTALRRGSVILLSKLRLMNEQHPSHLIQQAASGQHHHSVHQQATIDGVPTSLARHQRTISHTNTPPINKNLTSSARHFNYQSVPRLSLTRAESSARDSTSPPNSGGGGGDKKNGLNGYNGSDIVIGMGSDVFAAQQAANKQTLASAKLISGRHSISNFPSAVTAGQSLSIDTSRNISTSDISHTVNEQPTSPPLPLSPGPSSSALGRAGSIINWLGGSKDGITSSLRRRSSGQQSLSDNNNQQQHALEYAIETSKRHSSCFSQASATTSVAMSQEESGGTSFPVCGDAWALVKLKSNWRRRRSFSGPYEWLWHESHPPGQDLMIEPETKSKRGGGKKRAKRIKAQRSNSSDYHSLNNRRVYRLDSRGFQTKLRGTFYVITHDPLLANNNHQSRQRLNQQQPVVSCSLDHYVQQQSNRPQTVTLYSKSAEDPAIESSLINSSLEENNNNHIINNNNNNNNNFGPRFDCCSATSAGSVAANTSLATTTTTTIHNTHRHQQPANSNNNNKPLTFLIYFRWTKWMLKRRHYSLFIFSPKSRLRRFCNLIIKRKEFDYFVLFFISMNCVTLAMERPIIPPNSKEREFLIVANYYFTFLFTLEMALKVIAKGLYYGHGAYLSDNWNIMDGVLVGFSLFDLLLSIVADRSPRIFAILRVFRLLRSLRPLRVINRLMGLKLVVQTLLLSLRPIGNIVLICCTFFIIFGILGVQLFKGTFFYCDGPDPLQIMRTVNTREDCLKDPRNRWVNRKYNFDNLGQALMALFVLSSKDGWVNIMYTGLDAVGVDIQPRENYNEWRLLYFISFLLLVAFFVLNMFVGVVVENFHRCRKEQELEEKARRAEKRQRKLDKRRRKLREPPYYSNYGRARAMLHRWVTGGYFDLLIAAIIGFNVIFMSLEHYQMAPELINLLKVSNYIFTVAFILEAMIKTTALGMRRYLKDRWNQLDVMIVAMSIVGIVFEELESFTFPINPTLLRVLRVMRIARVLKLLKMAKGIRALLDTVMQALPQVGNLGLLFFLLFFIFAALGVELFGRLECSEEYPCSGLMDQHAHFQNFGLAFLTLFRVATGDNWNGIMKDTLRDKCDASSNCLRNCCVSQIIAPLYFVIFVLLAQFVLVNVVVAVLMKHLEESHHEMEIDEEYELDKQLAEELAAKKRALLEARERQTLYWI